MASLENRLTKLEQRAAAAERTIDIQPLIDAGLLTPFDSGESRRQWVKRQTSEGLKAVLDLADKEARHGKH